MGVNQERNRGSRIITSVFIVEKGVSERETGKATNVTMEVCDA